MSLAFGSIGESNRQPGLLALPPSRHPPDSETRNQSRPHLSCRIWGTLPSPREDQPVCFQSGGQLSLQCPANALYDLEGSQIDSSRHLRTRKMKTPHQNCMLFFQGSKRSVTMHGQETPCSFLNQTYTLLRDCVLMQGRRDLQ